MRRYNEVVNALAKRECIIPEAEDIAGCDSFAAGFIAGAEADPEWLANDDHWTFAAWAAYLGGKPELVSRSLFAAFDQDPGVRANLYKSMSALILAANDAFLQIRHASLGQAPLVAPVSPRARVGRNDPCPCGSGKKYKRCCI
jgi:uncharacterized protein